MSSIDVRRAKPIEANFNWRTVIEKTTLGVWSRGSDLDSGDEWSRDLDD
jgi:hypothetical protein